MIRAVFDANVLYSVILRGIVIHLAAAKIILPLWSEEIQDEWTRNLLLRRPDLKQENVKQVRHDMNTRFPESHVTGYEHLIETLTLPHQKDRHVLAAAIHAEADCIVTFNLDDFPQSALTPYQVEAVSPDDFFLRIIKYDTKEFINTISRHRAVLSRPSQTVDEYLTTLEMLGLTKTVASLQQHRSEI